MKERALKPLTIKTIAKELGLSLSAVSKALNNYPDISESTRKAVVQKAMELGYSPNMVARNLVKNTSNSIGVVVRDTSTIYGEMLKPISQAALKNNLTIVMGDSGRSTSMEMKHIRAMIDSRVMGLIIAPVGNDTTDIDMAVAGRFPVVYLGSHVSDNGKSFVTCDSAYGAKLAMDYLFSLGHRDIAFISDRNRGIATNVKLDVYRHEMNARHLNPAVFIDIEEEGGLTGAAYRQVSRLLDDRRRYTAVFAVKDMLAAVVMQALREKGVSVPEDISVIGYDGAEVAGYPMVNLTTIAQPKKEIAEKLIEVIARQYESNGQIVPEHYFAKPELVVRKSCMGPSEPRIK